MKKIVLSLFTTTCLIFTFCGTKQETKTTEAPAGMVALDLGKYGKQFSIFVPDTTVAKLQVVEQSWGALEISVGKGFQISITEDAGDIELMKSDIKSDDVNLFKSYIVDEPQTIMWESEITKPEYHFYTIQKIGNNTYVIRDLINAKSEFTSKEQIQKMLDSSKQLVAKEQPTS